MADQFLPVLLVLAIATFTAIVLLGLAALVSQRSRHNAEAKRESYESGVPLLDRAQKRISIRFYLVALLFVVLDVEVAFLYPWAVTFKELVGGNSLVMFWDMVAFIAFLAVVYIYLWRKGVFDWGRRVTKAAALESRGPE
ncbi:MAG: NAD(P)H-quinone oxidoreductase subunit 3 [bacterium]|nr:NAD(P)H-quinone oxidoreductase subunit 3 [bacterium]